MKIITNYVLSTEEKQAIRNVVNIIDCDCQCENYGECNCPFLMKNDGCMVEAMNDILNEQEKVNF